MITGVSEQEAKIFAAILDDYRGGYQFWAYGSRVKGGFCKTSDLDILIRGKTAVSYDLLEELKRRFDESRLPYVVNFADFHQIDPQFYRQISSDLVAL